MNIKLEPKILEIITELNRKGNQCLIVGGAVRDAILGVEPDDIDIEVYKINYQDLCAFLQQHGKVDLVGKKFGTIQFKPFGSDIEYDFSIPRKENKAGIGHKDFDITFDIDMTIKEAAERRDFTFNAMAYDPLTYKLYDYFDGLDDIRRKTIRHTSNKFNQDALRIYRAMQFQCRFGFQLHPDTIEEIKYNMLGKDDFLNLPKERIFWEWEKWAKKSTQHHLLFHFMYKTGLIEYYPELKALKFTQQDPEWHPEGDVEVHTALCLKHWNLISENIPEVFTDDEKIIIPMAILLHDIGKPATNEVKEKKGVMRITSEGHEALGGTMAKDFLDRIGFPEKYTTPICNLITNHLAGVNISCITAPSGKRKAVKRLANRLYPATINQLLTVMMCDTNGRNFPEHRMPTGYNDIKELAKEFNVLEKKYEYILMGRHLAELGLQPGPQYGNILSKANEAQENGEFNDIDGAKKWLTEYLKTFV